MVSDLQRIEIHTNFTGLSPVVKVVTLDDLAADDPSDALAARHVAEDAGLLPKGIFERLSEASHAAARAGTGPSGPRGTGTALRRIEYCWITGNR